MSDSPTVRSIDFTLAAMLFVHVLALILMAGMCSEIDDLGDAVQDIRRECKRECKP